MSRNDVKQSCLNRENRGSLRANAGCYATRRLWGQDYVSLDWAGDNLRAKRGAALMIFSHPLARRASVFTAKNSDGSEYRVLAIVTTLELDPKSQNYKNLFVKSYRGLREIVWLTQTRRPRSFS
jgi:hypothetical protein